MALRLLPPNGNEGRFTYTFERVDGPPFSLDELSETDIDLLRYHLENMLAAVYADDEQHERKAVYERRFLDLEHAGKGSVARVGDEVSGSYPVEAIRYGVTAGGFEVIRHAPPLVRTRGGYEPTEETEEQ
jgi:hypothetical protein